MFLNTSAQRSSQVEVIDQGIVAKQAAVVSGGKIEAGVALVDGVKRIEKIAPTRVGRPGERRDVFPGALDQLFRKQAAIFAEGHEDDAVEQPLCSVDRHILRHALLLHQFVDQALALIGVIDVELVADLALLVLRAASSLIGAGNRRCGCR